MDDNTAVTAWDGAKDDNRMTLYSESTITADQSQVDDFTADQSQVDDFTADQSQVVHTTAVLAWERWSEGNQSFFL